VPAVTSLDEVRRAALAAVGSDKDAETERIEHLTKELSSMWEDLDGLNEVFRVTQESIRDIPAGNNHQKGLEKTAEGRAELEEVVSKLCAAHDET
jgi:hypothetical protein